MMINFSYNLTPDIRHSLNAIDKLREKILLYPISPKKELQNRWEALVNRILYSLRLDEKLLEKNDVLNALTVVKSHRFYLQNDIDALRQTYDYIYQEWLGSAQKVSLETLINIQRLSELPKFTYTQKHLEKLLDYLNIHSEHPIIQAALSWIGILQETQNKNPAFTALISYLFLYQSGYDFRGLLNLEEYFCRDSENYQRRIKESLKSPTLTSWLEYFSQVLAVELEKTWEKLRTQSTKKEHFAFWNLNERQKEILSYLENPEVTITNRRVQSLFKISQITASRDLAGLTNIGMVYSHGKGRSIYYTRI